MTAAAAKHAMTAAEKILARACGQSFVRPGQVVYPEPELVIIHDGFVETTYQELSGLGYGQITRPDRVMFVTDHEVAYGSQRAVERGRNIRRIAAEWRVGKLFDVGRGGHGHLFPIEEGLVRAGMFLFCYDMHASNFGSVGALALAVGSEISTVLATGSLWTQVPATVKATLFGRLSPGAHARDVGFVLAKGFAERQWGFDHDSCIVEFDGESVAGLDLASRVALCNSITEIGVATVFFAPDSDRVANSGDRHCVSDLDAAFEATMRLDLAAIGPQVALPGSPGNAVDVKGVVGERIDHAFIGACGSGMYEDFVAAARAMQGRKVASHVRLFVVPGTVSTARRLADDRITQAFLEAGAIVLPPGCGPCAGGVMAPLGPGEVSIATAATNHAGRFGSNDGQIYLASPLTVAASAVAGKIVDPREYSC